MTSSLLLQVALASAALALRVPSEGDVDPALPAAEDVDPSLPMLAAKVNRAVPAIGEFRELWMRRYSSEMHLWEPMPSSIRLVLGLFTVAPDVEYREVVRQTWLNQTGVCYWRREPQEGCSVYVAFVMGKEGEGELPHTGIPSMGHEEVQAAHRETGVVVLDTAENMNAGKSMVWFDTARRFFPWATHVGKIDMDTYPFLHKLVHRMEAGRECSLSHGPYEVITRPWGLAGEVPFAYTCGGDACPQFQSAADSQFPVTKLGEPWHYLSGELYVLSMPLVQQVYWHDPPCREYEDIAATRLVGSAARKGRFCVVMRRLDAWYHRNSMSDVNYANDL